MQLNVNCSIFAGKIALKGLGVRNLVAIWSVKVIIPGLCHIFPYFGLERLYQVPVKMGWLEKAKIESELNQQALLI